MSRVSEHPAPCHDGIMSEDEMASERDFNARNIAEFRANEGKVGGQFEGFPLLIMTSTGAKSGERRENLIGYFDIAHFDARGDRAERPGFSWDFDAVEVMNGYQDPVRRSVGFGEDKMLRRVKQGLARNASDIQASSSQSGALVDQGDLEPELGGAKSADITTGAGADDDKIEGRR